jgi:hypothetical protein
VFTRKKQQIVKENIEKKLRRNNFDFLRIGGDKPPPAHIGFFFFSTWTREYKS